MTAPTLRITPGRINEALSGAEARNERPTNSRPYQESFVYDALGHLTGRPVNKVWSGQGGAFAPAQQSYVNERNTIWEYDDEGNLTNSGVAYTIDAAGQTSRTVSITNFPPDGQPVGIYGSRMDLTQSFDGDGLAVKKLGVETLLDSDPEGNVTTTKTSHQSGPTSITIMAPEFKVRRQPPRLQLRVPSSFVLL